QDCYCGNGTCDLAAGEACNNCPADCGPPNGPLLCPMYNGQLAPTYVCGNGTCDAAFEANGETCATCAADCGLCCGNGACDDHETCTTCPADCGHCGSPGDRYCGDGICDVPNYGNGDLYAESVFSCPQDCGSGCGDGKCDGV